MSSSRENPDSPHYPRQKAIRIITQVLSDRVNLDDAQASVSGGLSGDARAWLQEVTSGVLRWKGRLDLAIDSAALKKKPTGWLRKAMLTGAYQLIAQDNTPAGRVVSEVVQEIKIREGEAPSRFANAVLRRISEHAQEWRSMDCPSGGGQAEMAKWASLPEWLWKQIVEDHGKAWAVDYAKSSLERPVLWMRSRPGAQTLGAAGPVTGSFSGQKGAGPIPLREGFAEGDFFVQDISSQFLIEQVSGFLKREAAGEATPKATQTAAQEANGRRLRVLDLCAAPGGKSVGLGWNDFDVTSTDQDGVRLELLKQTVNRVCPEIQVVDRKAVAGLPEWDAVWVDAPCSGTGILRRHPDVRWLRQEKDLEGAHGLLSLQKSLLQEAWSRAKPGGFVIFSVCSVLKDEGPKAIDRAGLSAHLAQSWFLTPQAPPHGDGFWAGILKKPLLS